MTASIRFVLQTSTELEVCLREYLVAIRQADYSERTIGNYEWHLDRLLIWLCDRGADHPRLVTRVLLREWGSGLYSAWQSATVKQAVNAARSFFGWLKEEGLLEDNPALALKMPKEKKKVQRTVTADEVSTLVNFCDTQTVQGLRDRAIVAFFYDSGPRTAEAAGLQIDDLDLSTCTFKITIKGGDEAPGWFGETTREYLEAWIKVRDFVARPGCKALFVSIGGTRPGTPMTPGGLSRVMTNLAKKAGLKRLSAHAFRRGFAVSLSDTGVPDELAAKYGRWTNTRQLRRYTAAQQVGRQFARHSPVENIKKLDQNSEH